MELGVIKDLVDGLRLPLQRALPVARALISNGRLEAGEQLVVVLDQEALWVTLSSRLEFAIEVAPLPRRGRPPGKAKRGA